MTRAETFEESMRNSEKLRESRRAHFTTQKILVHLLRTAAKASHRSNHPEMWARTLAPIFNNNHEEIGAALAQLGEHMEQMKESERKVREITHGVLDRVIYPSE